MPHTVTCPSCKTVLGVTDNMLGKQIRCSRCQTVMLVPALAGPQAPAAPPPVVPSPSITADRPAPAAAGGEARASRSGPAAQAKRPPGDRAKPPQKSSSSALLIILVAVGAAGLLGVVVCGGGIWYVYERVNAVKAAQARAPAPRPADPIRNAPPIDKGGPIKDPPWFDKDAKGKDRPPDKEGPDLQRPAFDDAVARQIALEGGSFQTQAQLDDKDPLDRAVAMPVKLFLVKLEAGQVYLAEMKMDDGQFLMPRLRLEDQAGTQVAASQDAFRQPCRLAYVAPRAGTYRLVAGGGRVSKFTVSVRKIEDGDPLPPDIKLPTAPVPPHSMQEARKVDSYLGAAIAPDCKSAFVAFPGGKLQRFACPDFEVTGTYQLPNPAYCMALDTRGVLYAVVQINASGGTDPRPTMNRGPAHLHLYDTKSLPADGGPLKPTKVLPLRGIIQHLFLSPDEAWLYYLDSHNRKVGRIDLKEATPAGDNDQIEAGTNSLCLTPDGKTLYTCSTTNVVQKLDPATLKIVKTIKIDRGKPRGIQATDNGYVFLASGEGVHTHIFLLNANRAAQDGATVVPWAGVYVSSSIRLAPDQKRLYTACFGLSPANITALHIAERPALVKAQQVGAISLPANFGVRGQMEISRDGRFLFCDRGVILQLGR